MTTKREAKAVETIRIHPLTAAIRQALIWQWTSR